MNQIQLDCFIAAALNGSISTAAKSLFLSTQVVSQHIQRLEAELGNTLFIRTKNGVSLTKYGQDFFNLAADCSVLYSDTRRNIEETYHDMASSLNIGISEYIDYMGEIAAPLLSFTDSHNNIVIKGNHYKSSDLLSSIESGDLDIAIIPDSQIVSGGDFEVAPFAKENLHMFINAEIDDKNKDKIVIGSKELNRLCDTLPQLNTSYGVWTSKEWAEVSSHMSNSQNYDPKSFYELPNFRSVVASLKYIPAYAVSDLNFGYPIDESIFHTPLNTETWVCCVWYKRNENRLIKEFSDHLIKYYS
ncbi:MAG: LysR family transcriptional regulator [Lachnospiraceae bacterium]|nr:LysR family transcriptional regulator [Lachnospiraceae bacterium]